MRRSRAPGRARRSTLTCRPSGGRALAAALNQLEELKYHHLVGVDRQAEHGPLLLNRWGNPMQRHNAPAIISRLARDVDVITKADDAGNS